MKKYSLIVLIFILLSSCNILEVQDKSNSIFNHHNPNIVDPNIDYPTIYYPLAETELNELQIEFDSLLGSEYDAFMDEYGLVGSYGLLNRGQSSIEDVNEAISIAKSAVTHFSKFTNVSDSSLIVVNKATNIGGYYLFTDWVVSFENQIYDGYEVLNTRIMVLITDEIIQVRENYYTDIFVPTENRISVEDAQNLIIGSEIEYYDFVGLDTLVVKENMFYVNGATERSKVKILPRDLGDSVEMRVCWRVPIFAFGGIYPDWYVFVDILSGEVVTSEVLFIG
ncbi:MAG: hypothetical protein GQ534_08200 [Candidatus Delongbacteria bacterium]|nr:hypothetical protein [Candidatus Delongbacteria bacterium]